MWAGGYPVYVDRGARRARVIDVDGHEYVDFCLGDTGAMAGHSPPAPCRGRSAGAARDHDDAADRGRGVGRRGAGAPLRAAALAVHADRDRRQPLARCGSPARSPAGRRSGLQLLLPRLGRRGVRRARADGAPCARARATSARRSTRRRPRASSSSTTSTRSRRALAHGDVPCVLIEPALTNIGIVLPEPGFHDGRARR